VVVGAGILIRNKKGNVAQAEILTEPWIVVETEGVIELDENESTLRRLETGDKIASGETIQTNATGRVVLHFPDGSEARLEPNTTLTITNATYDIDTDSLTVRLVVGSGRLWSNIVSFVNPGSVWEVETAHAVATVRGTTFGTDATTDTTTFVGSESTVAVFLLDPQTGTPVPETETNITTDEAISLTRDDIAVLLSEKHALVKKKIEDLTHDRVREWIERERTEDGPLRQRIEDLRTEGLTQEEIRAQIRTDIQNQFRAQIKERRDELQKNILTALETKDEEVVEENVQNSPIETLSLNDIRALLKKTFTELGASKLALGIDALSDEELLLKLKEYFGMNFKEILTTPELFREQLKKIIDSQQTAVTPQPTGIKVRTTTNFLLPVTEGTEVRLEAFLELEDGSTKNVTPEVTWEVVGPVGSIISPGVFRAHLDPSVAEFGESSGAVTAVLKDGLKAFIAKTPIFKVVPKLPTTETDPLG
jgi:hypothetical protein